MLSLTAAICDRRLMISPSAAITRPARPCTIKRSTAWVLSGYLGYITLIATPKPISSIVLTWCQCQGRQLHRKIQGVILGDLYQASHRSTCTVHSLQPGGRVKDI